MIWRNQTHRQHLYYWILYVYIVYQGLLNCHGLNLWPGWKTWYTLS